MLETEIRKKLVSSLDLADLAEYDQDKIIKTLEENIIRRVNLEIATILDDKQNAQLVELIERDDMGRIRELLSEYIPDLMTRVGRISRETVEEFKSLLKQYS